MGSFFDSLDLILNDWYMLSRSCYIENDAKAIKLLDHGCKCTFTIGAGYTQSKSLLRVVLMIDLMLLAITSAVLFFSGTYRASPSGTSSPSKNGIILMKNRSTASIY